jgi:hypothetical protein
MRNKETIEEAAENFANSKEWIDGGASNWVQFSFKKGAKWQSERIPSIIEEYLETAFISKEQGYMNPQKWFEQSKKK